MIEGITVLSQTEVVVASAFNWQAFTIAFIAIAILAVFAAFGIFSESNDRMAAFAIIVILAGGFFSTLMGSTFATPVSYETHYKVTVDDSVSMAEFLDKYEIIETEGKIYTVRELNNNN